MAVEWRDVYSSNVARVGYDDESQTLLVEWGKGGKTSSYSGVPPEVAESCATNWSVGTFIHDQIKPHYTHKYL